LSHFGHKRKPDPGTLAGLQDNIKSEIDSIEVDEHIGGFDAEGFDSEGFDVSYKIFERRIIKA
jgi:hypothetical protein